MEKRDTPRVVNSDHSELRKQAGLKVVLGTIGCSSVFVFILVRGYNGHQVHLPLSLLLIPFVYGCVGAVELVSGVEFQQLVDRWATLSRWQQRSLGALLMAFGSVIVVYSIWLLFRFLS